MGILNGLRDVLLLDGGKYSNCYEQPLKDSSDKIYRDVGAERHTMKGHERPNMAGLQPDLQITLRPLHEKENDRS